MSMLSPVGFKHVHVAAGEAAAVHPHQANAALRSILFSLYAHGRRPVRERGVKNSSEFARPSAVLNPPTSSIACSNGRRASIHGSRGMSVLMREWVSRRSAVSTRKEIEAHTGSRAL